MQEFTLHNGDCLEVLRTMPDNSVDAVVTDPPYGLAFMGKRWDYDVPSEEIWRECLRVLKPGGHLLAFAGTRTQHRMAVRIEDAGFEIRDMIAWVYGSGFPKSLDVSKAIDKAANVEGTFGAPKSAAHAGWIDRGAMRKVGGSAGNEGWQSPWMNDADAVDRNARQYIGGTEAARQWAGWGTALKPALEPITVARKPLIGTVAENVLTWGTGGVNIDATRVGTHANEPNARKDKHGLHKGELNSNKTVYSAGWRCKDSPWDGTLGRWPANLIHDGSEEVVGLFPVTTTGNLKASPRRQREGDGWGMSTPDHTGDSGSAARFFYCAKASKRDRDEGCEGMADRQQGAGCYGNGLGNSPKINGIKHSSIKNHHPTVKPTDLMRYLCRLVTPPGGVVLDPFMGSGSTGKAAILEGFRFVGIEREAEYIEIARNRIVHAQEQANKQPKLLP